MKKFFGENKWAIVTLLCLALWLAVLSHIVDGHAEVIVGWFVN